MKRLLEAAGRAASGFSFPAGCAGTDVLLPTWPLDPAALQLVPTYRRPDGPGTAALSRSPHLKGLVVDEGQGQGDDGALMDAVGGRDMPAMRLHQLLGNGQAQARAAFGA